MNQNEQGRIWKWLVLTCVIVTISSAGVLFVYRNNLSKHNTTLTTASENRIPQAKINDTAPQLPKNQKTEVVTMQEDSTYQTYLVPSQTVNDFIKTLPPGVVIISKKSLQ